MKDISDGSRMAFWRCVIALVGPGSKNWIFDGRVDGAIALQKKGLPKPTLPYDSIFVSNGETRTFSEMSDKKNRISHRGCAVVKLKNFLRNNKYNIAA